MRLRVVVAASAWLVLVVGAQAGLSAMRALQFVGEIVEIVVPDPDGDGNVNIVPGPEADIVLFTGKSIGTTVAGACDIDGTAQRHLQAVTVVDPGAGRAGRRFEVIVLGREEAVRPGTRLTNLTVVSNCQNSDGHFVRVRGFVE